MSMKSTISAKGQREELLGLLQSARVIPVLTIERVEDAVPLARALLAGGVRVLEITLRTQAAIDAAKAIIAEVPEAIVGIGTVLNSEDLMLALARGFDLVKFFPAEQSGGLSALRALAGPFPHARFCPTGGIGESNAAAWLAETNVVVVGGSWLCPAAEIRSGNWSGITAICDRTMKNLEAK
jgi:2-dehydro-3-deoxyphosphogluconate aldolase/(4S)-4-hydroxy-2-oxoglutarate aldolase